MREVGAFAYGPGITYPRAYPLAPLPYTYPGDILFGNAAKPPEPPKKPRAKNLIIAALATLGLFQVSSMATQYENKQKFEAIAQHETSKGEIPPVVLNPELPGNVLSDVNQAILMINKDWVEKDGVSLSAPRGVLSYTFKLKTGKVVYLPVPKDQKEDDRLRNSLKEKGVVTAIPPIGLIESLGSMLSMVIWFGMIYWLMSKQMGGSLKSLGGDDGLFEARLNPKTKFQDVGGYPEVVEQMQDIVDYIKAVKIEPGKTPVDAATLKRLFPKPPKGILLTGPPGTGKTLMARAIAGEAGVPIIVASGSKFVELFVGNGARRVRELFKQTKALAQKHGAVILFLDEIDAVGKARATVNTGFGGHDEREQTLNELLVQMDGFDKEGVRNIIFIAGTNREDVLDPALVRPGRLGDKKIQIGLPILPEQRADILDKQIKGKDLKLEDGVNLLEIAKLTPGMAGADLENVIMSAQALAMKRKDEKGDPNQKIAADDLRNAIQDIQLGPKRKTPFPEADRRIVAYHEVVGHGLIGHAVGVPPLVISMEPRKDSAGHVIPDPTAFLKVMPSLSDKLKNLLITMGGRAAEAATNGKENITGGAASDYEQARQTVKQMLTYGMFRGFNASNYQNGEALTKEDSALVNAVIEDAFETARAMIEKVPSDKRDDLVKIALKAMTLQGEEARNFYTTQLPGFDWKPLESLAQQYITKYAEPLGWLHKEQKDSRDSHPIKGEPRKPV